MRAKKRVHVTLPAGVLEGLEAYARLRDQSLSDLLEDIGRKVLEDCGVGPEISAADIAAAIAANRKKKRKE